MKLLCVNKINKTYACKFKYKQSVVILLLADTITTVEFHYAGYDRNQIDYY